MQKIREDLREGERFSEDACRCLPSQLEKSSVEDIKQNNTLDLFAVEKTEKRKRQGGMTKSVTPLDRLLTSLRGKRTEQEEIRPLQHVSASLRYSTYC
jgi:hypothetical protein